MYRVRITVSRPDGRETSFTCFVSAPDGEQARKAADQIYNDDVTGIVSIEVLAAPTVQPQHISGNNAICPKCGTRCYGDCTASER